MTNTYLKFNNLNQGKLTSKSRKRTSIANYNGYHHQFNNFIADIYGGYFKRPGTIYGATLSNSVTRKGYTFEATNSEEFIIYLRSDGNIEIFNLERNSYNKSVTVVANTLSHPFTNIRKVDYVQIGNSLIFTSEDANPQQLIYDGLDFTLQDVPFNSYPMIVENQTIKLTASGTTITSDDNLFTSSDVGRHLMMASTSSSYVWAYAKITAYTSATQVTVQWLPIPDNPDQTPTGNTAGTLVWRLGIIYEGNYPRHVGVVGGRLYLGGYEKENNTISISKANEPFNFQTSSFETGNTADDDGVSAQILSNEGLVVNYLEQDSVGMQVGTRNSIHTIMSGNLTSAITPTSIRTNKTSDEGAADVKPLSFGAGVVFSHENFRNLYVNAMDSSTASYNTVNISDAAEDYFSEKVDSIKYLYNKNKYIITLDEIGNSYICLFELRKELKSWSKINFENVQFTEDIVTLRDTAIFLNHRIINGNKVVYLEILGDFVDDAMKQEEIITTDLAIFKNETVEFKECGRVGDEGSNILRVLLSDTSGFSVNDKYFFTYLDDNEFKRIGVVSDISSGVYVDFTFEEFEIPFEIISKKENFATIYKAGLTSPDLSHLEGEAVSALINNNSIDLTVNDGEIELPEGDIWNIQVGKKICAYAESVDYSLQKDEILNYQIKNTSIITYRSLGGQFKTSDSLSDFDKILDYTPSIQWTTYLDLKSKEELVNIIDSTDISKRFIVKHEEPYPFYIVGYYIKYIITKGK